MTSIRSILACVAISTAATAGCAPSGASKVPPRPPNIGAPSVPWHEKTRDEKQGFMGAFVEPTMRHKFQSWNQKAYVGFGCETCHGADMDAVNFHMPNSLYALSEKDTIAEATSYDEKTTKFMMEQVVPTFATLLSEHAGNPGDSGGVSCFTCHPHE